MDIDNSVVIVGVQGESGKGIEGINRDGKKIK